MCLLAQINPCSPRESQANREAQIHHAHQVCGIVAHTTDRGVASVAIRSLAIASSVLTDRAEQTEVIAILEKISRETGWRLEKILGELKKTWAWDMPALAPTPGGAGQAPPALSQFFQQQSMQAAVTATAATSLAAPTPTRAPVNPMLAQADFSLPNHPYQNWYEPPNRTTSKFNVHGFWST